MSKIQIGDLFQADADGKQAFMHYVGNMGNVAQLARVFYHFGDAKKVNLSNLVKSQELFLIFFPLAVSYRKKLIDKIDNYPVPENFSQPKFMRSPHIIKGKFLGWHIVDIETLQRKLVQNITEEQRKLSPWGIWNKIYLIEHLEKNWTLDKWNYN
jgi:hypothetical protein